MKGNEDDEVTIKKKSEEKELVFMTGGQVRSMFWL